MSTIAFGPVYRGVVYINSHMRTVYTLLTLLPAPLFFLGFVYSSIFGHHGWEMALMWSVMFLAHLSPWFIWWQQRNLTRNT